MTPREYACPPTAVYRFGKFSRRNKRVLATASVVVLTLCLGAAISTWQAIRATTAEELAQGRLEAAESQRIRAEANERNAKLQERLATDAQQDSTASLKDALSAVDQMLTRVSEERIRFVPQMEPVRRDLLQDALSFYQKFLERNGANPSVQRETALAYRRIGNLHY